MERWRWREESQTNLLRDSHEVMNSRYYVKKFSFRNESIPIEVVEAGEDPLQLLSIRATEESGESEDHVLDANSEAVSEFVWRGSTNTRVTSYHSDRGIDSSPCTVACRYYVGEAHKIYF
jgi:hypothetical protein